MLQDLLTQKTYHLYPMLANTAHGLAPPSSALPGLVTKTHVEIHKRHKVGIYNKVVGKNIVSGVRYHHHLPEVNFQAATFPFLFWLIRKVIISSIYITTFHLLESDFYG